MGSFVVFLSDKEELKAQLEEAARKHNLERIILSTFDPAGPEGFQIAEQADVTVVLYDSHKVRANHAFAKGELTDKAIDAILADVPKILPKK
jgi:L-lactate utilization protein LutC